MASLIDWMSLNSLRRFEPSEPQRTPEQDEEDAWFELISRRIDEDTALEPERELRRYLKWKKESDRCFSIFCRVYSLIELSKAMID